MACPHFNQTVPDRGGALLITSSASFGPNAEWLTPVLLGRLPDGTVEGIRSKKTHNICHRFLLSSRRFMSRALLFCDCYSGVVCDLIEFMSSLRMSDLC